MPIYEYKRPDGSTFELVQSFSDDPLTHDPETGVPVQRVLHAPAVHFKGSGFYNTDYGTRKRQRENAATSDGSAASENGKAGKGDSAKGEGKAADGESKAKTEKPSAGGASAAKAEPATAKS